MSIPQQRSFNYILQKPYDQPNGSSKSIYVIDHETKTIYESFILQNALNLSLNAELWLAKKLYFQTGVNVISNFERNSYYSDSLYLGNGMWGRETLSKIAIWNFLIPIGLQYRISKNIFVTIGVSTNFFTSTKERDIYYGLYQVGNAKSFSNNFRILPEGYVGSNLHLLPRTYLNLKISYNSLINFSFNVYYSIGVKFFII